MQVLWSAEQEENGEDKGGMFRPDVRVAHGVAPEVGTTDTDPLTGACQRGRVITKGGWRKYPGPC